LITPEGLFIEVFEYTIQENIRIPVDAIVLSIGMLPPRDLEELIAVTRVSCGTEGFVREAHLKLAPVEAPTKGWLHNWAKEHPRKHKDGFCCSCKGNVSAFKRQAEDRANDSSG
jgi:heterodisulfide reductase subunit A-like polyferredoxin